MRARRGCAGKTRLRVALSTSARVSVRVKRLRRGHRPRRVRAFGFVVAARGARPIKGQRLGKGRYVVVVRAYAAGRRSAARTLRLRVRKIGSPVCGNRPGALPQFVVIAPAEPQGSA